jgi:hypothetical protein
MTQRDLFFKKAFLLGLTLLSFLLVASATQNKKGVGIEKAILTVRAMSREGRSRAEIAAYVNRIVSSRITSLNQSSPTRDGRKISQAELEVLKDRFFTWRDAGVDVDAPYSAADWAWKNRIGQCSENAHTAFHILALGLKNTDSLCEVMVGDHTYVIFGDIRGIRGSASISSLQRLKNTWIIDPWDNRVASTRDLRWYHYTQTKFGLKDIKRVASTSYRNYIRLYQRWIEKCRRNPKAYQAWLRGKKSPGIIGTWRRNDGHVVRFSGNEKSVTGAIVKLTPLLKRCGFSVGETTFRLTQTGSDSYSGKVRWRSTDGRMWWQKVTMTVSGNSMTGAGHWTRQ